MNTTNAVDYDAYMLRFKSMSNKEILFFLSSKSMLEQAFIGQIQFLPSHLQGLTLDMISWTEKTAVGFLYDVQSSTEN